MRIATQSRRQFDREIVFTGVIYGGNQAGSVFRVTTWGESHGAALAAGCGWLSGEGLGTLPKLIFNRLWITKAFHSQHFLQQQGAGANKVEILSGVFEGRTTGTPVSLLIRNSDAASLAYDELKDVFRPGQGDYTYLKKYGIRDWRLGGSGGLPGGKPPLVFATPGPCRKNYRHWAWRWPNYYTGNRRN